MTRLPKNKIPFELTKGLYKPEYVSRDVSVTDIIQVDISESDREEAWSRIRNKVKAQDAVPATSGGNNIPVPLTEAEAEEADRLIQNTLQRIQAARGMLTLTRESIEKSILDSNGGKELKFNFDISKKPRLKRAIKKLFGEKLDTITYSMYKELLKAKYVLERQEAKAFAAGKIKDEPRKADKKERD